MLVHVFAEASALYVASDVLVVSYAEVGGMVGLSWLDGGGAYGAYAWRLAGRLVVFIFASLCILMSSFSSKFLGTTTP